MAPWKADQVGRHLGRHELFAGIKPAELERLVRGGRVREYAPQQSVVRQGEFGHSMFFVLQGSLLTRLRRLDGSEVVLGILKPGQSFGELGLAGDRPRASTVIANEPSLLFEVERGEFAKALGRDSAVIRRLDQAYRHAAVAANLYSDPLFADLGAELVAELIAKARMRSYEKDETIVREGEEGDAFYVVWSGHVRISRRGPDGSERIFAYVAEGDYFGEIALVERRRRTASAVANDHVELICIAPEQFERLLASQPSVAQRLRERIAARTAQADQILRSSTRQAFISDMIQLGAAFAANALVINLNTCTRCGACASACHDLYGNSRLTRRGKTFVLPQGRESLLMPNSCWHCKDPECMIGCPTNALRRGASGEIQVIEERCIGCEICANRCPWGNITMAEPRPPRRSWLHRLRAWLPGRARPAEPEPPGPAPLAKAIKCDLCQGQPEAACVMACPYGAIERIDPNVFLRQAIEAES